MAAAKSVQKDYDESGMRQELARNLEGTGLKGIPLPVPSVGVKADVRSYEHPALLTGEFPGWDRLTEIAAGLAKRVEGLNRSLYLLSGPAEGRACLVPATVTRHRLELLRQLDQIVMDALANHGLMSEVWQCPTILVPVSLNGRGQELMVVRPVHSERAMTARPAWLGESCTEEIRTAIQKFEQLSGLAIDATTKPPVTIEWE